MKKFLRGLSGALLAFVFVAALLLALFHSPKVRAAEPETEQERVQLPPAVQAQCWAEGGCVLVTHKRLEQLLQQAAGDAVAEAIDAANRAAQVCRGSI